MKVNEKKDEIKEDIDNKGKSIMIKEIEI